MPNMELCAALSNAFGPSGFENDVADIIESHLPEGIHAQRDCMQNLYAARPENAGNRPLVLLDAHTDEVGFMVQSITPQGLLRLVPLGSWVDHNIPAHTFTVRNAQGEALRAVSGSKPPHFMSAAERSQPVTLNSILLDAGVSSREEAAALGLKPGLPVAPDTAFSYNEATGMMLGKAFDCRLGCAAILETLRTLAGETLPTDVSAAFSTQEEVGLRGARVTAERLRPALAICLEGTPADDTFTPAEEAQGALKKGVQLRFRDNSMVAHPGFMAFARRVAEENNIPHQCAVRTGGGTNAGSIHLASGGVPTVILGIPVRYAHTSYGYAAAADVDAAVRLTIALLRALTPDAVRALNPRA